MCVGVCVCVYGIYEIPFGSVGGKVGGRLGCLCVCVRVCERSGPPSAHRCVKRKNRIYIRYHAIEYTTLYTTLPTHTFARRTSNISIDRPIFSVYSQFSIELTFENSSVPIA